MTLRPWGEIAYLPMLGMKPAEMRALEELPGQTKDALMPVIPLRPWVGARRLQSVLDRITQSYGDRPVAVAVGDREPPKERDVFAELERLRNPSDGYGNWCDFIRANPNYVPVAQLGVDFQEEIIQIRKLAAFGRGVILPIAAPAFGSIGAVAQAVASITEAGDGICFLLDYGVASRDHLQVASSAIAYINTIRAACPRSVVSISASSFPFSFADRIEQPIYERLLFNELVNALGEEGLIYSDRGSARAEQLSGGSGVIPARIDYPLFNDWKFYRSDEAGFAGYVEQARALMADSTVWNPALRVWGTQMIERTARGDHSAIDTPNKSTAARINLHLQLQTFYDRPAEVEDTEEDWDG